MLPYFSCHLTTNSLEADQRALEDVEDYLKNAGLSGNTCSTYNIIEPIELGFCKHFVAKLFKQISCIRIVCNYESFNYMMDTTASATILFINTTNNVDRILEKFVSATTFNNLGKYKIIVCETIFLRSDVLKISETIWKHKILDFVLLYSNITLYQAIFNPFVENQLSVFTKDSLKDFSKEFPDKLQNMNGYPIKLLVSTYPSIVANARYDYDINFIDILKKYLNATYQSNNYNLNTAYYKDILQRMANDDSELNPYTLPYGFLMDMPEIVFNDAGCSYPVTMNNIHALVPKPQKIPNRLIWFSGHVWVFLVHCSCCICMAIMDKYLLHTNNNKFKQMEIFNYLSSSVSMAVVSFTKNHSIIKLFWLINMVFLNKLYDLTLLNSAIFPKYTPKITSMQDAVQNGLEIFAPGRMENINYKLNLLNASAWKDRIMENKGDAVYLGTYKTLDMLGKIYVHTQKTAFNYEIMNEPILLKYGCYIMKRKSPYKQKINGLVVRVAQMGFKQIADYHYLNLFETNNIITITNLSRTFFHLSIGWLMATLLFFTELIWEKMSSVYNKNN